MFPANDLFSRYAQNHEGREEDEMTLLEYLEACKKDPLNYAASAEQILAAIGEAEVVDTAKDPRLGRIFMDRTIKIYPAFIEFFGMEETIERIVEFFRHGTQGLEEQKRILYLLGPVCGGKSSLAERLKSLIERQPICALKAGKDVSPLFESPIDLFVSKMEPGDENNQDISSLVGKVDILKSEMYSQNGPDACSFSGGLNRLTQDIFEFVEMFKTPLKMRHVLRTVNRGSNLAIEPAHRLFEFRLLKFPRGPPFQTRA